MELPYLVHFGLKEEPFSTVPSPAVPLSLVGPCHRLSKAEFVVETKKGLAAVFGDTGTGKSSLARLLHQQFQDGGFRSALITNPSLRGPYSLLRTIPQEMDVPRVARSYKDMLALYAHSEGTQRELAILADNSLLLAYLHKHKPMGAPRTNAA